MPENARDPRASPLACQSVIDLLGDWVADELTAQRRVAVSAHLAGCATCRDYLGDYRKTIALAKAAYADDEPDELPDELVRAILAARERDA
jgi:anti-sigma factor RsiW